jgi:hypothetical protein
MIVSTISDMVRDLHTPKPAVIEGVKRDKLEKGAEIPK